MDAATQSSRERELERRRPQLPPAMPLRADFASAETLARAVRTSPNLSLVLAVTAPLGASVELVVRAGDAGGCVRARSFEEHVFEVDARDRWVVDALLRPAVHETERRAA